MAGLEGYQPASRIELSVNSEGNIEIGAQKVNAGFASRKISGPINRAARDAGMGGLLYKTSEASGLTVFNHDLTTLVREMFD